MHDTAIRPANSTLRWRDHLTTILLGTWLMIGLFVDGWAHNNLGAELETFFTPWHAVFYSGFLATAGWMCWLVVRNVRNGLRGSAAIPHGYGLGMVGLIVFGAGGFGDMIWHIIFGIETDIEALLSPMHLLIFLGGVLIMASPVRAFWRSAEEAPSTFGGFFPILLSVTMTTAFIAFMNMYLYGFLQTYPFGAVLTYYTEFGAQASHIMINYGSAAGLGGILVTTTILLAPLLLTMRRWHLPLGSVTFYLGTIGLLMGAMAEYDRPHMVLLPLLIAGIFGDALRAALKPSASRATSLRIFAVALPVLMWAPYMVAGVLTFGAGWSLELTSGIVVMAALLGLGLSVLIVPEETRSQA